MAKIRKPKKIMTMDKYTTAYDGYDVEGKIPRNTDGEEEVLTPGQKSLVWEKKKLADEHKKEIQAELDKLHKLEDTDRPPYAKVQAQRKVVDRLVKKYEKEYGSIRDIDRVALKQNIKRATLGKSENYKKGRTMAKRINEDNGKMVEFEVPGFYGFYESMYTDDGDLEYAFFNNPDAIDDYLMDLFKDFDMDWSIDKKYVDAVGEAYTETFDATIKDIIPAWKGSTYVETESPREYNFTTDRVFAKTTIDETVAQEIGEYLQEHKAEFAALVKRKFTSRDGFMSFYSNDVDSEDWQKELVDMDHNELSTVLEFILENELGEDAFSDLNWYTLSELRRNGEDYQYFLYDKNYDELVNYINDNAVMKPALDDLSELENYLPTGEEENGLPVYELDLHDQPGQQHLDFSKVESLNRRARRVLSEYRAEVDDIEKTIYSPKDLDMRRLHREHDKAIEGVRGFSKEMQDVNKRFAKIKRKIDKHYAKSEL